MTSALTASTHPLNASAIRLRLTALPENVMLVRQALDGASRELGASHEIIDDLKLAVTEACSNVVKYAYRGAPGNLEVSFDPTGDGFVVNVKDEGTWLDQIDGAESAGGLGIPLMEAVTREFAIETNGQGTTVRLEFALTRDAAQLEQEPADA